MLKVLVMSFNCLLLFVQHQFGLNFPVRSHLRCILQKNGLECFTLLANLIGSKVNVMQIFIPIL